jgi:hypothetical protein
MNRNVLPGEKSDDANETGLLVVPHLSSLAACPI